MVSGSGDDDTFRAGDSGAQGQPSLGEAQKEQGHGRAAHQHPEHEVVGDDHQLVPREQTRQFPHGTAGATGIVLQDARRGIEDRDGSQSLDELEVSGTGLALLHPVRPVGAAQERVTEHDERRDQRHEREQHQRTTGADAHRPRCEHDHRGGEGCERGGEELRPVTGDPRDPVGRRVEHGGIGIGGDGAGEGSGHHEAAEPRLRVRVHPSHPGL
jgi:hypothetical protein